MKKLLLLLSALLMLLLTGCSDIDTHLKAII